MTVDEAIKEIRSKLGVNNTIIPYSGEMEAFGMALEALERNQPKKVTDIRGDELRFGTCPSCGRRITTVEGGNYCQNCGQRLEW